MHRLERGKQDFVDVIMRQVDDIRIEEGKKVSIRDIGNIFTLSGFELSEVQAGDIYSEMDNGKAFNRQKF